MYFFAIVGHEEVIPSQKWFGSEIIENLKQTLGSLHLSEMTQNIVN
jgi:hypothetical protein